MKKIIIVVVFFGLLFLGMNCSETVQAMQIKQSSLIENADGSKYYNEGGIYLGRDLKSADISRRFYDVDYAYDDVGYITNFYDQQLFAMNSTNLQGAFYSPCVTSAIMGTLKGLEVQKKYEQCAFPVYGSDIGRYVGGSSRRNHNFASFWPTTTSITLSGQNYRGENGFPLAVLENRYSKMSYVYNEHVKLGYYVNKYGASTSSIVTSISEYLKYEKSSDTYRYSSTQISYFNCSTTENAWLKFRMEIGKGNAVMFGDNDFIWAAGGSNQTPGGHAMVAVGAGHANIYDSKTNSWKQIEEVIYDQGGGEYCAMPFDDIYDFFTINLKLEKKEKYGLFNMFTRWVEV